MELLADFDFTSLWPVLGMLLLCGFLLRRGYGRLGRRMTDRPSRSGMRSNRLERPREETDAEAQFARWEVRMHEVARELSAQLDSKMIALEQLIRMADESLARWDEARREPPAPLDEVTRTAPVFAPQATAGDIVGSHAATSETPPKSPTPRKSSHLSATPSRKVPLRAAHEHSQAAALAARVAVDDEYVAGASEMAHHVPTTTDGGNEGSDVAEGDDHQRATISDDRAHPKLRTAEVYSLADSGHSSDEIAKATGSLVGEVELILSLRSER